MIKTKKKHVETCPSYATISVQDALRKRSSVEETDTIWIPPDTKEKSRGLFKSNTISGSTFLDMLKKNTMLRECQLEFLMTGKVTSKTVSQDVIVLDCYKYQADNGDFSEHITSDTVVRLAQHPKDLPEAVYNWIPRKEYEHDYVLALRKLWESSEVKGEDSIVPDKVSSGLKRLKIALDSASSSGRLHIHIGAAGTGKSTTVSETVNGRKSKETAYVVSLSNTIGLMFKQKVPGIRNYSCCAAFQALSCEEDAGPVHSDYLVLDEFSQWGFEWLWLMVYLVERNPDAEIHIMGDVNQIPTFLCSGNLLNAIVEEYPSCVVKHEEQHRFTGGYKDLMDGILNKGKFVTDYCFTGDKDYARIDCVITGTNKHVESINREMFEAKHGKRIKEGQRLSDFLVPGTRLLCSSTSRIGEKAAGAAKVFRNERFVAVSKEKPWVWVLKSEVDGRMVAVHSTELDMKFTLGYAITVNRAQGLEWDNVMVVMDSTDYNLMGFSPLYVALSRGRKGVRLIASGIGKDMLDWYLSKRNKYTNHFDCIKFGTSSKD